MFYHRCCLVRQINTTISEQGITTDNLMTNTACSSVIILAYLCCIVQTAIDLCVSCVLTTFNKNDDDDLETTLWRTCRKKE